MKKYEDILKDVRMDRIDAAVESAARLYMEKGIDEIKMTDIADECQIGVASLYRYFGTKQKFTIRVAAYIWKQQMKLFEGIYDSEYYHSKTGLEQIEELMKVFYVMHQAQSSFLRFVANFDAYIVREDISQEELTEYNSAVLDTMPLMEQAILKGTEDGTIRQGVDTKLYYFTVSHSLMSLCQKLACGRLLDSDDPMGGDDEVLLAIKMFVSFIKA